VELRKEEQLLSGDQFREYDLLEAMVRRFEGKAGLSERK